MGGIKTKLRRVIIKNFRSLVDVDIPISDNSILIGENNAGKTAMLEALHKVLNWKSQSKNFEEYDYHMVNLGDSPQSSEGITIELWFKEDEIDEWEAPVLQDLGDIIQTDIKSGLRYVGLRIQSTYDEQIGEKSTWNFLTLYGDPLTTGRGARKSNIGKFLRYVRIFYLSSLRDSRSEFSARSKFWGKIIRDMKISEETRDEIISKLSELNTSILEDDERLGQVIDILDGSKDIMGLGGGQRTSIRALPTKPWELLSKSEVVIKSRGNEIDFPISLHGHGIQSLAIIFLFQAYIDVLLKPSLNPETVAIMALEEPEAHLHPQAIRALASNLLKLNSQKIISSHSPYFIQEIPFKNIIMFRRNGAESKVLYIKQYLETTIEVNEGLKNFCDSNPKFNYDETFSNISLEGVMTDTEYGRLIRMYSDNSDICRQLTEMKQRSKVYIDDNELNKLETYAKRIRGEILFARGWILCEGQSDYLITRFFADLLGKSLDPAGIAVIDFQNNGSPKAFAALAEHFEIPWVMFCDNDDEVRKFNRQIKKLGFTDDDMDKLFNPLPGEGSDLEAFLVNNGFKEEYQEIIAENNSNFSKSEDEPGYEKEFIEAIRGLKPDHASYLIEKLKSSEADETRVPEFFKNIIEIIFELTEG